MWGERIQRFHWRNTKKYIQLSPLPPVSHQVTVPANPHFNASRAQLDRMGYQIALWEALGHAFISCRIADHASVGLWIVTFVQNRLQVLI